MLTPSKIAPALILRIYRAAASYDCNYKVVFLGLSTHEMTKC